VHSYENTYYCAAVDVGTGEYTLMNQDACNSIFFNGFLQSLSKKYAGKQVCLVMDNAAWHKSTAVQEQIALLKNLHICFLPPYSPEYNPIERLWLAIKTELKDRYWPDLMSMREKVEQWMESKTPSEFIRMCRYPYIHNIAKSLLGLYWC
jgi:transposase